MSVTLDELVAKTPRVGDMIKNMKRALHIKEEEMICSTLIDGDYLKIKFETGDEINLSTYLFLL